MCWSLTHVLGDAYLPFNLRQLCVLFYPVAQPKHLVKQFLCNYPSSNIHSFLRQYMSRQGCRSLNRSLLFLYIVIYELNVYASVKP
jgi:hypothetical protein